MILLLVLVITSSFNLHAQQNDSVKKVSPLLVTNSILSDHPVILIKWLTDKFIYPTGVNIYRQELGEFTWTKLNNRPLTKGTIQPALSDYVADSTLRNYVEMAKGLKPIDLKGMTKVMVLVKSVQNDCFARYLGIEYVDTTFLKEKTYRYKVTFVSAKGEESIGLSEFIKSHAFIPEASPSGIIITAVDNQVNVNWQPEDLRFHGVNIYRCSANDLVFKKINQVPLMISKRELPDGKYSYPDVYFTDRDVHNNVKYTYQLTCIDFFGRESGFSDKLSVTPGDKTPPLEPYAVNRKIDKYNVRLSWKNRISSDQEGISIYRSFKYDNQYVKVNPQYLPITDTVYIDKDLKAGYYYYIVASADSAGNEGKSGKIPVEVHDITPPSMPQNIIAIADTGRILLKWDANLELDLMGYQVYRTVDKDLKDYFVLLNAKPVRTPSFIDTLPKIAKNKFLYRITAVDSALNRSDYSATVKAQMPDVTCPAQPVIIGAEAKGDYLVVEWIPNRELDLAGYELYRSAANNKGRVMINTGRLAPVVTRFTDRTVVLDSLYQYSLVALDSAGNRSVPSIFFPGRLINAFTVENESEILKFGVVSQLFSEKVKLQWKVRTGSSFIGYAIFCRDASDGIPQRLSSLIKDNSMLYHPIKKTNLEYQLRVYHKTGQILKSAWVIKK